MMTKKDRSIAAYIDSCRSLALDADVRHEFNRGLVVAEAYLAGEQYPTFENVSSHDPYYVINLCADLVDRLVPLIAGGRLITHIEAQDPAFVKLSKISERFHQAWQKNVMLREKNLEIARDMISTGLGVARGFVDPYRNVENGGMLGIERVYPSHVWIDPSARDPFDALLGSEFIGYETASSATRLVMEYPDYVSQITGSILSASANVVLNENDPLGPILESMSRSEALPDREGGAKPVGSPKRYAPDDLVRLIQFEWKDYEKLAPGTWAEVWKRGLALGAQDGTTREILSSNAIPYERPSFALCSSSIRRNSPYGQGILSRIGDVQDLLNVIISMIMKAGMMSAKVSNVIAAYAQDLDPAIRAQLLRGNVPAALIFEGSARQSGPIGDKVTQLRFQMQDYSSLANMLGQLVGLFEGASGVNAAFRGSVKPEKRMSGVALEQMASTSIQARDTQKAHMNAFVTNLGTLGYAMAAYHWSSPMVIRGGEGAIDYANLKVPMNMEGSQLIDHLRQRNGGNPTLVPNAIGVQTQDGEEQTYPLYEDTMEWALDEMEAGRIKSAEYILNDMSALDVDLTVTVEADFMDRHEQKLATLFNLSRVMQGSVSWETLMGTAMEIYPDFSIEQERERLDQDELLKNVRMLISTDPQAKAQVASALQQIVAQRVQGQAGTSAQSPEGQLRGAGPTGVIPEEGTGAA